MGKRRPVMCLWVCGSTIPLVSTPCVGASRSLIDDLLSLVDSEWGDTRDAYTFESCLN